MKQKFKTLENAGEVEKVINEKFGFIDFEEKRMKNCGVKFNFMNTNKNQIIQSIVNRQKQIAEVFMKHKDNIHEEEDPAFLDVLSDVFDIRNWKLLAFNAATPENEKKTSG